MINAVIFPSEFLYDTLCALPQSAKDSMLLVLRKGETLSFPAMASVTDDDFDHYIGERAYRAFPCSEAAVYFLWDQQRYLRSASLSFSHDCFSLFLKTELGRVLTEAGIPCIAKTVVDEEDLDRVPFPGVVKPNFGFGSQLVRRVEDRAALDVYLRDYRSAYEHNVIDVFRKRYLGNLDRSECMLPVLEEDRSDLVFVSCPFVVQGGAIQALYPAAGRGTLMHDSEEEHHVVFDYPAPAHTINREQLLTVLQQLKTRFGLSDGVYHSEFLCSMEETYLVEFSPRLTGGAIAKMISLSEGIDLHALSLFLFLGSAGPEAADALGRLQLIRLYTSDPARWEDRLPHASRRLYSLSATRKDALSTDIIALAE